jgi:type IV pilus assembly protein PilA
VVIRAAPLKVPRTGTDAHRVRNRTARRRIEDGYTFIEVTLVVLIMGLLIAISIPSFLGAKRNANDRAAQVSLRHTLTNAKAIYSDDDTYANVDATRLHAVETSLTFASGVSTGPNVVSVDGTSAQFVATARSDTGLCYAIGDAANRAATVFAILAASDPCDAASAPPVPSALPGPATALIGGGWARAW